MGAQKRIGVLISGNGSNLQALLDAGLPVALVISNRPDAYGLQRAQKAGVATTVVDHQHYRQHLDPRSAFEAALQTQLDKANIDIVILAGFMRILTDDFVRRHLGHMLNIHPSLLPKYKGLNTHTRALAAGDQYHGSSVHFVIPELDGGPVILQGQIDIQADDSPDSLAQRVQALEHIIYPKAVDWLASGRLHMTESGYELDGKRCTQPALLKESQT